MTQWYRIHFRNMRTTLAHGEAERDQILARKVPKAVHVETAAEYICETCAKASAWPQPSSAWADVDQEWRWYGRRTDIDAGEPVRTFCSRACEPKGLDRNGRRRSEGASWAEMTAIHHFEPVQKENWRELEAARKAANPRVFPFPQHDESRCGVGFCRWCGGEIVESKGKRAGERSIRRTWHRQRHGDGRDCYHEFLLHTDAKAQYWEIVRRDGPGCGNCGHGRGRWEPIAKYQSVTYIAWSEKLEVDHVVPLWRRDEVDSVEQVRAMHGLDNLWLLCIPCHKRKTAIEARQRAEARA